MSPSALRTAINKIWDVPGTLKFVPLGRGHYIVHMLSHIERERVLARRIWNFKFGTVKVQHWTPEFNPYKVNLPISHVWIPIYELSPEYFYEPIINDIASAIGPVIAIDERTRTREMLHFARVLLELDLLKEKESHIMYERSGYCSTVSIGYEQHPEYCKNCDKLGH